MSLGTFIDAAGIAGISCMKKAGSTVLQGCAFVLHHTWKPTSKLLAASASFILASHYYCPMYETFEREFKADWIPSTAKASSLSNWYEYSDLYAAAHKRNKCFVRAVIKVESENCTQLVSTAGALGCMQIMPSTARGLGMKNQRETLDQESNIAKGIDYLFTLIDKLGVYRGLQAYNAGEARIDKTRENVLYPHKVLTAWMQCIDDDVRSGIPDGRLEHDLDRAGLEAVIKRKG